MALGAQRRFQFSRNIIREAVNAGAEDELLFLPSSLASGGDDGRCGISGPEDVGQGRNRNCSRPGDRLSDAAVKNIIQRMGLIAPIVFTCEQVRRGRRFV